MDFRRKPYDTGNQQRGASHSHHPERPWTAQTPYGAKVHADNPYLQTMQRYDWQGHQQETTKDPESEVQHQQSLFDNFKKAAACIEALSDQENYRSSALVLEATLSGWASGVSQYDVPTVHNAYLAYNAKEVVKAVKDYDTASQKVQEYYITTSDKIGNITYGDARMKWQDKLSSIHENYHLYLAHSGPSREIFNISKENLDRIKGWLDNNQQQSEHDTQKEKLRLFANSIEIGVLNATRARADIYGKFEYNPMYPTYRKIVECIDFMRPDFENGSITDKTGKLAKELLDQLNLLKNLKSGSILGRHRDTLRMLAANAGLE